MEKPGPSAPRMEAMVRLAPGTPRQGNDMAGVDGMPLCRRDTGMGLPEPHYMIVSPAFAAMLDAYAQFDGRDRRRIKREVNKAVRRTRAVKPETADQK